MKVAGASRRSNVATSQRRDVGSTNKKIKQQRRDVAMLRRCNVATSTRDLPFIINSTKDPGMGGIGKRTAEGTEIQSRATPITKKSPRFVLFPIFLTIEGCFTY